MSDKTLYVPIDANLLCFAYSNNSNCSMGPPLEVLYGYALHSAGDYSGALAVYGKSNLVDQRRVAYCLLQSFIAQASNPKTSESFSALAFIGDAYDIKPTLGLHAFRLGLELVHTELRVCLGGPNAFLDPSLTLKSSRCLPRASSLAYSSSNKQGRRSSNKAYKRVQFSWVESDVKSDIVNEAYICTKFEAGSACELSTGLIVQLREILKSFAQSSSAEKYLTRSNGICRIKINSQVLHDIQHLSAFKKFEIECCQLQKVDLTGTTTNERLLFFVNVYNMLMGTFLVTLPDVPANLTTSLAVHGTVKRGGIGHSLIDRMPFMRSVKYNIGGHLFSLLDVSAMQCSQAWTVMIANPYMLSVA